MSDHLQTSAAMGIIKSMLVGFNIAFWVSSGTFARKVRLSKDIWGGSEFSGFQSFQLSMCNEGLNKIKNNLKASHVVYGQQNLTYGLPSFPSQPIQLPLSRATMRRHTLDLFAPSCGTINCWLRNVNLGCANKSGKQQQKSWSQIEDVWIFKARFS